MELLKLAHRIVKYLNRGIHLSIRCFKMQPLSYSFMVFKCVGVWRPVHWSTGWKTIVYDLYTSLMIFFIYTCTISEFIDLIRSFDNVEEFANASFMLLTMIGVCGKAANLLKKRGTIIELMNVLQNDICRPRSAEEIQIQSKYEQGARFNTLWYGVLTGMASASISVRSLILDIPQRALPYKAWIPYDYDTSQIGFWFAYFHLLIAPAAGALVNIAFDTLVPGVLMQTCAQITILKSRLYAIPKTIDMRRKLHCNEHDRECQKESRLLESELLTECIRHHLEIYRFAKTSNDVFGFVVFLQYSVSSVVICVSVYELSKVRLFSTAFAASVLYLACMLAQIFIYCFYGGETTLQSMAICDAVYSIDWSSFGVKTNKSLVTIMMRSQRSITFTCASILTLSLDTFSKLIKLSYSTYSVLQQSGQ